MIIIKASAPQPIDCNICRSKQGYKVTTRIQKYVDTVYSSIGSYDGCIYSDHEKTIRQLKKITCANCNAVLNFRCKN
jgi:hypothetical protein